MCRIAAMQKAKGQRSGRRRREQALSHSRNSSIPTTIPMNATHDEGGGEQHEQAEACNANPLFVHAATPS